MFGVYFQLCCRWSVEAWSKWQISCRRHSQMHCLWTNVDAYIVEYRWFLFLRIWLTNIGPIVRGQFPLLRVIYQGRLNIGRKVTASQSGSGTYIDIYVHGKHTFDKPHPWNRRSIYFNRSIAAMRPMKTRRGSDKDVFRSLKCSCHSGARVEVTNPIFSVPLFFQFFKNYKNTGYLHDIMFIVWKLLQQLSCGDT